MLDTGTRLNELRVKHKMTHQQLADESGVSIGTVKSILSGQTQNAGFSTVCALLEAMNEPITEFYTRKTEQEDEEEEQKPAKKQLAPQHIQPQPCFQRVEMRALAKEAVAEVYRDDLVIAANREKTGGVQSPSCSCLYPFSGFSGRSVIPMRVSFSTGHPRRRP